MDAERVLYVLAALITVTPVVLQAFRYTYNRLSERLDGIKSIRLEQFVVWIQHNSKLLVLSAAFGVLLALSVWWNTSQIRRQAALNASRYEASIQRAEAMNNATILAVEATYEYERGAYKYANKLLLKAIEASPENPYVLKMLARTETNLNLFESALERYRDLAERQPGSAEAYQGQIISLYRLGKFEDAINIFETLIENNSIVHPTTAYTGGNAYARKWEHIGQYNRDSEYFMRARSLFRECAASDSSWASWCFYNEACLQALSLNDLRNDSERKRIAKTAIQLLNTAVRKAQSSSMQKSLIKSMCADSTLYNIQELVQEAFCVDPPGLVN